MVWTWLRCIFHTHSLTPFLHNPKRAIMEERWRIARNNLNRWNARLLYAILGSLETVKWIGKCIHDNDSVPVATLYFTRPIRIITAIYSLTSFTFSSSCTCFCPGFNVQLHFGPYTFTSGHNSHRLFSFALLFMFIVGIKVYIDVQLTSHVVTFTN